jgi:GTP cyclohydrolase IA
MLVRRIEFYSLCEPPTLRFHGKVNVGYIPNGKIVGLSKTRLQNSAQRRETELTDDHQPASA